MYSPGLLWGYLLEVPAIPIIQDRIEGICWEYAHILQAHNEGIGIIPRTKEEKKQKSETKIKKRKKIETKTRKEKKIRKERMKKQT